MSKIRSGAVRRYAVRCCMVGGLAVAANRAAAQTAVPAPTIESRSRLRVTPENVRLNRYLHSLSGPGVFLDVLGGGLLDQLWRKPSNWSSDGDGLARRIGARATQAAVQVSVRHGLAAIMHRSTDYQSCQCRGLGPRIGHALLETFTDRGSDGARAFSVPRIAGAYAGGLSRLAWEPQRSIGDVALSTTVSLGFTALLNVAGELTGLKR